MRLSQKFRRERTVMSTPSSARMRAAYDVASSAVDILKGSCRAKYDNVLVDELRKMAV